MAEYRWLICFSFLKAFYTLWTSTKPCQNHVCFGRDAFKYTIDQHLQEVRVILATFSMFLPKAKVDETLYL